MSRGRHESGIAVPIVMMVLAIVLIFGAVVLAQSSTGLSRSAKEVRQKQALEAAKAGLRTAIGRMNGSVLDANQLLAAGAALQCIGAADVSGDLRIVKSTTTLSTGWCPSSLSEPLQSDTDYSYELSPVARIVGSTTANSPIIGQSTTEIDLGREIVATGIVNQDDATEARRRVYAEVTAAGSVTKLTIGGLTVGSSLEAYRQKPATFKECSSDEPSSGAPDTGC